MPKPLLARIGPDTIREFRAAALHRAQDAAVLADADRRLAAVYLWGYAVEMTVKAAYFDALGFDLDRPILFGDLKTAKGVAVAAGIAFGNLHDVHGWGQLLVHTRATVAGLAYPHPPFGDVVIDHCRSVYDGWKETLRYHPNRPYEFELTRVRAAGEWLLARTSEL